MKKSLITASLLAFTLSAAPTPVTAQDDAFGGLNPWLDCGIGALIFPDHETVAAISNIIWDLGTTAVTSASASRGSCNGNRLVAAQFVTDSYANLEEEVAQGEGKHLQAMLNLMQCETSAQPAAINAIRSNFAHVMSAEEFATLAQEQKAEALFYVTEAACTLS
ncbi:hypothetical protein CWE13_05160 [Aliidiomarina shirensis]|uniref:DUF3015 domain-containing protein n=1 Tax=Aliidiomarina shirensis TaxID=1048642 RepID=A0A432WUA9_9GAMM|nr:DUF3015 family protein [Aliidiomarina shirensis]RUO37353.1 hypothetical protein CWE13_05160 [Aliidiomarina shirensis]